MYLWQNTSGLQEDPHTSSPEWEAQADEALLAHYRASGDMRVIGELYTRYTHLVYGNCLRFMGNEEDAKDAVMQVFEKLIRVLAETEIHYFSSWLYQVSSRHCLMVLRKRGSEQRALEGFTAEIAQHFMENGPGVHLNEGEGEGQGQGEGEGMVEGKDLAQAMASLKEGQRRCVELMYLEGLSYQAIAEETGYSLKQVKSYIQNAKRNLKILLSKVAMIIGFLIHF
jgi:RNA polymerase sigma-70 factor (ECF subfamily)